MSFTFGCISINLNADKKFILIIFLYDETDPKRLNEYKTCLEKNMQHPLIEMIHVIYQRLQTNDSGQCLTYLQKKDVILSFIESRPTYHNAFRIANECYPDSNIIISNADIYFNETLFALNDYSLEDKFLALTRWNLTKIGTIKPFLTIQGKPVINSQDVWIFQTPLRPFEDDIQIGTLGCDRRIAYWAKQSGLTVLNPCLTVQCIHVHLSNIRHYDHIFHPQEFSLVLPWCQLDK